MLQVLKFLNSSKFVSGCNGVSTCLCKSEIIKRFQCDTVTCQNKYSCFRALCTHSTISCSARGYRREEKCIRIVKSFVKLNCEL